MMYAVILAGGSGTRFWPKSRRKRPKQLLNIVGATSMLRQTVERVLPLIPYERILIVSSAELADMVRHELPELPGANLLVEPVGRNTTPAIGLAAMVLKKRDPNAVMVVLPADHAIRKKNRLLQGLRKAERILRKHPVLITLGIRPTRPETGYGYIEQGEQFEKGAFRVRRFTEKPVRRTAERFLKTGRFLWNSGMFIWKAADILSAIQCFCPELYQGLIKIEKTLGTDKEEQTIRRVYKKIRGDSIDYSVLEKTDNILVIPADLGWNDVGSWSALDELLEKDKNGNVIRGDSILLDTRNSIFYSEERMIAAIGVEDLIIVETADALLVCRKSQSQDVRKVVDILKEKGLDRYL